MPMHIGLISKRAQTARATDHGVDRGTVFDVRSVVVVLRFPSMMSSPGISALSVIRCMAVRPPHGWAVARRPVFEESYTRMLKHVTVDSFANPYSPHSCRCRCCVCILSLRISSSNSKTIVSFGGGNTHLRDKRQTQGLLGTKVLAKP